MTHLNNRLRPLAALVGLSLPFAVVAAPAAQETTAPAATEAVEPGPVEQEPNDRMASATPIASEASIEGRIDRAGDVDWYAVAADDRGELAAWFDSVPAGIEPMLQLWSDDREAMTDWQRSAGAGIGPELIVDLPHAGRFAIAVRDEGDDGVASEPYRLALALTPPLGSEEPNDRPSQAIGLAPDATIEAAIFPRRDPDWYAVAVAGGGELTVTLSDPPPDIEPALRLWGADRGALTDWLRPQVSGGDITAIVDIARAGHVFVEVHDYGDDGRSLNPYRLTARFAPVAADPYEPNNLIVDAAPLALDEAIAAALFPRGDADLYAIDVAAPGEIAVRVGTVPMALDLIMRLWTPDVEPATDWARAPRPGADVELVADLAAPGRYVLELRDNGEDARGLEPYRLTATLAAAAGDGGEPNGRPGLATALTLDGSAAGAAIFPRRDHDWYIASVDSGGTLTLTVPVAPAALDIAMQVFDGDRQPVANPVRAARPGATLEAEFDLLAAGDYFVDLYDAGDDARALEPYQLAAAFAPAADAAEPDAATAPRPLSAGEAASAAIFPRGDHDWFAIDVAAAGVIEITLPNPPRGIDLAIRLWSAPDAALGDWVVPARRGSMLRAAVPVPQAGTYLIEVRDTGDDQRAADAYRIQATVR